MTVYYSPEHDRADIGIMLGRRSVWGMGLGLDAWSILLEWLLNVACVRKVTGGAMSCNIPMLRIMDRSGMTIDAVRSDHELLNGTPQDLIYFSKFRESV